MAIGVERVVKAMQMRAFFRKPSAIRTLPIALVSAGFALLAGAARRLSQPRQKS
jgi:hypothetical protein